jgi:hypothetical protein
MAVWPVSGVPSCWWVVADVLVGRQGLEQQFQGYGSVAAGVVGAVDLAHSAVAEQTLEPVRAEHRVRHAGPPVGSWSMLPDHLVAGS